MELLAAFNKIERNASVVDDLSVRLLKLIWPLFDAHVLHIISHVLAKSTFPLAWKGAIRKSGKMTPECKNRYDLHRSECTRIKKYTLHATNWIQLIHN